MDLSIMRHSCSHLLAAAILELYPKTKLAIGPSIETGFYYDFDLPEKLTPEEFGKIENKMAELRNKKLSIVKKEITKEEAEKLFKDQPYKLELIKEVISSRFADALSNNKPSSSEDYHPKQHLLNNNYSSNPSTTLRVNLNREATYTIYILGDFTDLCAGPHVSNTSEIGPFKLLSIAGAYWKGSEKNKMLTRIYGTCFATKEELDKYLWQIEEAKKRDHRSLGQSLDLFSINEEVGKGLILWHPKLASVRHEVEKIWKEKHLTNGYQLVYTPHLGSMRIFTKTRHYSHYMNYMFPVMLHQFIEGESSQDYIEEEQIKPMNCPFHCTIYKSKLRSYKDLPIRYAELGTVYRYERSGQLHGMTRVRGFTQDDSHIFCRKSQAVDEVVKVIKLTKEFYDLFGFKDFKAYLSTMPEKHLGIPKSWQFAENALSEAIKKCGLPYEIDEGQGAFYGPKIDFKVKDSMGREWQLATVQWDFNLPSREESSEEEIKTFQNLKAFRYIFGQEIPGEKYDTKRQEETNKKIAKFIKEQGRGLGVYFTNEKGEKEEVVMIHRVILGALERFFGVLIEHYGGAFPVWLSPVQIAIIPIAERHNEIAKKIADELKLKGLRVEFNNHNERMQAKIRNAQNQRIPYMLIIGDKEVANCQLSNYQIANLKEIMVSVRTRKGEDLGQMTLLDFINKIKADIENKA